MNEPESYAKAHDLHRLELAAFAEPRAKTVWERHGFKPHMLLMHQTA